MLSGHQRVAVTPPGHEAIFEQRRFAQMLDQEKTADEEQQNDDDTRQTRGLPFGGLMVRPVLKPMVMSIQTILPLDFIQRSA
jgi:hypothetical protein